MRWARFASELCREPSKLPPEEKASIRKAEAYAQQVWAELGDLTKEQREQALQKAVDLYKQAIDLNGKFTVAYNNLGYLYLKRAEKILEDMQKDLSLRTDEKLRESSELIRQAEDWCNQAIQTEQTFHMAYDNKGNIAVAKARLDSGSFESHLGSAVECYHEALSYHPSYKEAYSDLAQVHSRLFRVCGFHAETEDRAHTDGQACDRKQKHHARLAWQHHWDALEYTADPTSKELVCSSFKELCSNNELPHGKTIFESDDITRAALLNCTCLTREVKA